MNFSYSRISCFERCPKKFEYKYILKTIIPDDDNVIFEKGRYLHALLEHYPNLPEFTFKFNDNESKKLSYINEISNLCRNDIKIKHLLSICKYREKQFYLDSEMNICDESNQLINGSIDYVGLSSDAVVLVDWKSGKNKKYASFEQLKLYAIWAFNEFTDINKIVTFLYFIEQGIYTRLDINRDEIDYIKKSILNKIDTINHMNDFKKIKKEDCQYCSYYNICQPYKVNIK